MGKPFQRLRRQMRTQPEIADRIETFATDLLDDLAPFLGKSVDLTKAETNGVSGPDVTLHQGVTRMQGTLAPIFQRAIPVGMIDVRRTRFHAVLLRITHQLRRRI